MPTKKDIQDLYFMDARFKLLEIASFLDRVDRHDGEVDFRHPAFAKALEAMQNPPPETTRAQAVHLAFSDHSTVPAESAGIQFALGAHHNEP
ncbi:MAG: hypothetical protein QNK80_08090 [Akkermansiaceae bacterium]|jgi:hypothetical protein|tara:strand:+ start:208 stop:483 length:276 start_codon:yes stop_codon:yes gene_type:complete